MAPLARNDQSDVVGARWAPAMRALGDERLARMVESGSESAFAAIYGRYAPILHGYCRSLLRDEEEAGDALQNAMLKALQAMRRAGRTGPLRPWLFRIAHNESVTIIRQRTRRPGPLDEGMVAGADDAFRHAAAREQLAALLDDMQNLTKYQRGALVMRELGGLTYDEIGSALETTPLAARQAVFVARRRLSEGPAGPRRLRPALLGLVGPAPAGLALAGALGSASFGVGTKVLASAVAAVSIGLGSVELVNPPDPPSRPDREVAAAKQDRTEREQPVAAVAETATPAATAAAVAIDRRAASAPTTATKEPADTAATRYVATVKTEDELEAEPEPSPAATSTPQPEKTPPPEVEEPAEDHQGPSHENQQERRPAAQQPQPTPPLAPPVQPQPRPEDHHGDPGPSSRSGPGDGDDHSGHGGGPGSGHEQNVQEAPDGVAVPVVQ